MRTKIKNLTLILLTAFMSLEAFSHPMERGQDNDQEQKRIPLRDILSSNELMLLKQVHKLRKEIRESIKDGASNVAKRARKSPKEIREKVKAFIGMETTSRVELLTSALRILEEVSSLDNGDQQKEMMKKSASVLSRIPPPPRRKG